MILRGDQKEEWNQAIQAYKKREFEQVIASMQPLVHQPTVSLEQLFYYGLAHLYTNPSKDAATKLV